MLFATKTEQDGRVVADVSFEKKDLAKMIGFAWDSIRRHWFTYDPGVAARESKLQVKHRPRRRSRSRPRI